MNQQSHGIKSIGQICVTVKDLEAAVEFYRDILGISLLFEVPGMAFFDLGSVRLMLGPADRDELDHAASIIYYKVDDIEASHKELLARGVTFEHEPRLVHKMDDHDLWMAFLRDMDQNLLGLMEERRPA